MFIWKSIQFCISHFYPDVLYTWCSDLESGSQTGKVSVGLVVVHDYLIYMMYYWIFLDTITNTCVHLYMYHISFHITCYTNISFIVGLRYMVICLISLCCWLSCVVLVWHLYVSPLRTDPRHWCHRITWHISFVWDKAFIGSKLQNDVHDC